MASLGRTLAVGLGIGLVGMQASMMLRARGGAKHGASALHQMLQDLRDGKALDASTARQTLAFWGLLSDYPAAAVALELSPLADICVRLSPYRTFAAEA